MCTLVGPETVVMADTIVYKAVRKKGTEKAGYYFVSQLDPEDRTAQAQIDPSVYYGRGSQVVYTPGKTLYDETGVGFYVYTSATYLAYFNDPVFKEMYSVLKCIAPKNTKVRWGIDIDADKAIVKKLIVGNPIF